MAALCVSRASRDGSNSSSTCSATLTSMSPSSVISVLWMHEQRWAAAPTRLSGLDFGRFSASLHPLSDEVSVKAQISQDATTTLRRAMEPEESAPARIPTSFSCFLDAQPASLVPRYWLRKRQVKALDQQLIVSPRCHFSR